MIDLYPHSLPDPSGPSDASAPPDPSGLSNPSGPPGPSGTLALDPEARAKLSGLLKAEALRLGFSGAGIARLDPGHPAGLEAGGRYRDWVGQGNHGAMGYMARHLEARSHPQALWPSARSLVAVAWNYYRPEEPDGRTGHIARYARGRDYHRAVAARLRTLARTARDFAPGIEARVAVDTGPILERAWAEIAGLGFVGKHAGLIRKGAGNYLLLGEFLLNVDLDPDPPAERRCGRCTRCLTACPTGAIKAPYQVDARRCISYLTIELRTAIPASLRPLVGQRVFGCDDCLDACPWNRYAQAARDPDTKARPGLLETPLERWLELDEEGFRERFTGTAILRTRRNGFLRNVAVALGNRADPGSVPALARALHDSSSLVRGHAAWALGRIAGSDARRHLEATLDTETDPDVRSEIRAALGCDSSDAALGGDSSDAALPGDSSGAALPGDSSGAALVGDPGRAESV